MSADGWHLGVVDELQGVGGAGVFSDGDVVEVDFSGPLLEAHVFQDRTELDGVVNFRLLLFAEADALGVAPSLDVEDALVRPDVLVVPDELTISNCAQGSLSRS